MKLGIDPGFKGGSQSKMGVYWLGRGGLWLWNELQGPFLVPTVPVGFSLLCRRLKPAYLARHGYHFGDSIVTKVLKEQSREHPQFAREDARFGRRPLNNP